LSTRSPYGCWLRFTEGLQTFNTIGDDELSRCASDWYAQSPGNSIAAFLYGWTLVNEAALTAKPGEREPLLSEALRTANRAVALHPQEASLHVLQLRAHVLLGNRDLARQAAELALTSAPDNRVIVGITGTLLTSSGNPEGERILRELESEEGAALPWEHAGHFVAAMMQDDIAGANEHMVHLEQFAQGQPLLLLFKAAAASRSGDVEEARSAIEQLRGNPRMVGGDIDALIEGLSMAPNVKTRVKAWLAFSIPEVLSTNRGEEQSFSR
jgi:Flp pilus assembly protein TadD